MTTSRPVTLSQMAKILGVSPMTVSRALNGQTGLSADLRQTILSLAAELGYAAYKPARSLKGARTNTLGIVADIRLPFMTEIVNTIRDQAAMLGFDAVVYEFSAGRARSLGRALAMLDSIIDGAVIALPCEPDDADILERRLPFVTIERATPSGPAIVADNYRGAAEATRHLLALGHRRIGFIGGNERLSSARRRHQGYRDALAQAAVPFQPGLVAPGDFSIAGGYNAAMQLLDVKAWPTAIFAANDLSAVGAMEAATKLGMRIPDDLSIIGFDDMRLALELDPPLTTVRQPFQAMAAEAVDALVAIIAERSTPVKELSLATELIARSSTRAIDARARRQRQTATE